LDDYKDSMKGIYSTSVNEATIDEAPFAYKSVDDIIQPISEAVDIIDIMKPIYNFKAK
jgi:tRNA-splicing ligase RtcB (3'-phosphate/5'-hydroxy nucleic acid ligase)